MTEAESVTDSNDGDRPLAATLGGKMLLKNNCCAEGGAKEALLCPACCMMHEECFSKMSL